MFHMKFRIFLVAAVIFAGLAIWVWFAAHQIVQLQRNVDARFHLVVQYYVDMRQEYVDPLQNLPGITDDDLRGLKSISAHLSDLATTQSSDDQYDKLLAVQHEMIAFFTKPGMSEILTTDVHYSQWNTGATNSGQSSLLLNEYNQALMEYNVAMKSAIGRVMLYWPHWNHPEYISVDGKTQKATLIKF